MEAPNELTWSYVRFLFSFAMARLGQFHQARQLYNQAQEKLDLKNEIHGFLARAYIERVEHAISGSSISGK